MNYNIKILFLIAGLILIPACDNGKSNGGEKDTGNRITIAGSSTIRPAIERISSAFRTKYPDYTIVIAGGGSTRGIKSAVSGDVMIGMSSREMSEKEKKEFPSLVETSIGYDGIAFIVNDQNPINEIDSETVKKIYTGETRRWKHNHEEIIPITKEKTTTTLYLFLKHFSLYSKVVTTNEKLKMVHKLKDGNQCPDFPIDIICQNKKVINLTSGNPNVISYVSIGQIRSAENQTQLFKTLSLDGVKPTIENIKTGTYPVCRTFNLITKEQPAGTRKKIIDLVMSAEGQKINES